MPSISITYKTKTRQPLTFLIALFLFTIFTITAYPQAPGALKTLDLKRGTILVLSDTTITFTKDTTISIPADEEYKLKQDRAIQSETFYSNLNKKSKENLAVKYLYSAVVAKQKDTIIANKIQTRSNFLPENEGKIVGKIEIFAVDMIEGDVNDLGKSSVSAYSKYLNKTHKDSRKAIIHKNLTFKEGDVINGYTISDNEYYLRSLKYIEDVKIYLIPDSINTNVVNMIVAVKDLFPITVGFAFTGVTDFNLSIKQINLGGTGNEFANTFYVYGSKNPPTGYKGALIFRNMWGSFFDGNISYKNTYKEKLYKVSANKDFISPETKYGGGLELSQQQSTLNITNAADSTIKVPYTKNYFNTWSGYSFLLNTPRRNNIIIKGRFENAKYLRRPQVVTPDTNQQFQDFQLILGSVSLVRREHYREHMLFGYGVPEDIDFGYAFELTGGYKISELMYAPYLGASMKGANYFKFGYLGGSMEYGTYIYRDEPRLGIFRSQFMYYSPLFGSDPSLFRFLTRWSYTQGINRYNFEKLNLSKDIRGISSGTFEGNKKLSARFEFVSFIKGEFYGFKFSPNLFFDAAFITDQSTIISTNNFVSSIGAGVRIKNEHLAFETIVVRLCYFPTNSEQNAHFGAAITNAPSDFIKDYKVMQPEVVNY